jgi:hypothetical protein
VVYQATKSIPPLAHLSSRCEPILNFWSAVWTPCSVVTADVTKSSPTGHVVYSADRPAMTRAIALRAASDLDMLTYVAARIEPFRVA